MTHNARIVDQFTKTAQAFASSAPVVDAQAPEITVRQTGARGDAVFAYPIVVVASRRPGPDRSRAPSEARA